jgi:hypothetical protein
MGFWSDLVGVTTNYFRIGTAGVRLKNNSGNLSVRNAGDSADASVTASTVNISGDGLTINSDAAETGSDYQYLINRPTSGMTADVTITLPTTHGTANQVLQTDGTGVTTWASAASTSACVSVKSTALAYGSSSPVSMFTLPANAVIVRVDLILDTPFSGGTGATVSMGVSGTASKYFGTGDVNLQGSAGDIYQIFPTATPDGSTEALILTYSAGSASAGAARVLTHYVVPA